VKAQRIFAGKVLQVHAGLFLKLLPRYGGKAKHRHKKANKYINNISPLHPTNTAKSEVLSTPDVK
jgi:hypothetical protein